MSINFKLHNLFFPLRPCHENSVANLLVNVFTNERFTVSFGSMPPIVSKYALYLEKNRRNKK